MLAFNINDPSLIPLKYSFFAKCCLGRPTFNPFKNCKDELAYISVFAQHYLYDYNMIASPWSDGYNVTSMCYNVTSIATI